MSWNVNAVTPVCAAAAMPVAAASVMGTAKPRRREPARPAIITDRGYGVWVVVTTPPEIDSELAGSL